MNDPSGSISEAELHAYVDGQLDPARHAVVDGYLATHPDDARRVAAYQRQRLTLRTIFAAHDGQPVPPTLLLGQIAEEVWQRRKRWQIAAALLLGLSLGGLGGWFFHWPDSSNRTALAIALLEKEALSTHAVYSADARHPIEVAGAEQEHLVHWLSNRLNRAITAPDLAPIGYQLLGGRLLATERGNAAALLMYEDAGGHRLSVVIRPMSPELRTPYFDMAQGTTNGCGWIEKGLGYAVVASLPDNVLERIADQIRGAAINSTG